MIVGERKPFEEIMEMISPYKKVLIIGCGGCVTVCLTGGEKQADSHTPVIHIDPPFVSTRDTTAAHPFQRSPIPMNPFLQCHRLNWYG